MINLKQILLTKEEIEAGVVKTEDLVTENVDLTFLIDQSPNISVSQIWINALSERTLDLLKFQNLGKQISSDCIQIIIENRNCIASFADMKANNFSMIKDLSAL